MIKKIIDKRNYIILFLIIILIIWILFFNKKEVYIKSFEYFGEVITFKIYDDVNYKKVEKDIKNIYEKYEDMDFKGELTSDEFSLIEYGKILYAKSHGYIDFTSGKLFESLKEGKSYDFTSEIDKVILEDNKLVNDIDFNFNGIISRYATNDVLYYFKQNDIKKYIVSEDGDVTAGKHYDDGKYKVSIINPNNDDVLGIVSLEKESMATRNKASSFKYYMLNPKTCQKEEKYDSVVVIAGDNLTASMVADSLYLMDIEEGKKMAKDYYAEALWVKDGEIIKTDGFDKYMKND